LPKAGLQAIDIDQSGTRKEEILLARKSWRSSTTCASPHSLDRRRADLLLDRLKQTDERRVPDADREVDAGELKNRHFGYDPALGRRRIRFVRLDTPFVAQRV